MVAKGIGRGGWAAIALFAHKTQPIMYHPELVDHCALILALLPTPGTVGHTVEVVYVSGSCMPIKPITFGDSDGETALRNFRPLGKVLSM